MARKPLHPAYLARSHSHGSTFRGPTQPAVQTPRTTRRPTAPAGVPAYTAPARVPRAAGRTGAHGTDTRPPGTARDRSATFKGGKVQLAWTPPGDDWLCGTPARYEIRTAAGGLIASGTGGGSAPVPGRKGDVFTIAYADEAGNWGLPAQFPTAR